VATWVFSVALAAQQLPPGTAIPIMVGRGFETGKVATDKTLEGEVMQDIHTSSGLEVKRGSKVFGHIMNVTKAGAGSTITMRFDAIQDRGRRIPIHASLIAMASMMEVSNAQLPVDSGANVSSPNDWVTRQIGGDIVQRGQGKVLSNTGEVGKWLQGGGVLIKLTPNPTRGCTNGPAYSDSQQAVWLFSSDACGTYSYGSLKIAKSGSNKPVGDIVLKSSKNVNIRGGGGWLLVIVPAH
jgi:hypothetical protein